MNNEIKVPFNNYVDKMRGGGGQKVFFFVRAQGIKSVHLGTSTSAYVATSTESEGVKFDEFLYPNFMMRKPSLGEELFDYFFGIYIKL